MAIVPATPYAADPATMPQRPDTARTLPAQTRIGGAVLAATVSIAFIGAMILAVEAVVGMVIGSFLHSSTIGVVVVAAIALPTVGWLALVRLPIAIRAERDAF